MKFSIRLFISVIAAAVAAFSVTLAQAQDWPRQPVKMIVPYAAGGMPDTMARLLGVRLAESMGQQMLVENRGGAGGISGTEAVAKSASDGYTLLIADMSQLAINPHLYKKLPYDPFRDLAPVTQIGSSPLFIVTHPSIPANNLPELVALLKANPGKYTYASSGTGSIHHLTMEALKVALGLDITHIPYKGAGQSVPALLGGQVHMLLTALPSMSAHVKSGKVRLIAASTLKRSSQAPDVPTIAEIVPGFDYSAEIGMLAPAGTPSAVISRLASEINKALKHPEVAQRFSVLGIESVGSTPEVYASNIRAAYDKYAKAVKASGAQAQD